MYEALSTLVPTKSSGCDNITSKLIKQCALALYTPLHHLFSVSLSKHRIPMEWKCHSITPIFKSGDKSQVKNYRPISLLCIIDVIYLDFKKAFDNVPHQELLLKLWKTGIVGGLWKWFREYLSDRYQHVRINSCTSSTLPVVSGVPQGSILGPLLFLIYINDLSSSVIHSNTYLFADDTKCLCPMFSPQDCLLLQSDLNRLSAWSTKWKLMFNESKCSLLSIVSHSPGNHSNHQAKY